MEASRDIELEGHIIDSGIMTQVFDRIMDMEGNFEILEFDVGKRKTDPSYAKLRVKARDETKLGLILSELHRFGARPVEIADCNLVGKHLLLAPIICCLIPIRIAQLHLWW